MSVPQAIVEGYRLSPQQQHLFSLPPEEETSFYRVSCRVTLDGDLSPQALTAAIANVFRRHEILRTTFQRLPEVRLPLQVIAEEGAPWECGVDLSLCSRQTQEARLAELSRDLRLLAFDYERGPLLRIWHVILSPTQQALLLSLPAASTDMAGLRNLVREISRCYAACLSGEACFSGEEPSGNPMQYADFSQWQNELLESGEMEEARRYWSSMELGDSFASELPFERRGVAVRAFDPKHCSIVIEADIATGVGSIATEYGVSPAAFLLTCWQILLGRLTRQQQVVVGTLCDGRKYDELRDALGFFAKYLPVSASLRDGSPFEEVLKQVADSMADVYRWQEYFEWQLISGGTGQRFFPYHFDFEERLADFSTHGLTFSMSHQLSYLERFKIRLSCVSGETLLAEFHYDSDLYLQDDVERLASQFHALLQNVVKNSKANSSDLEISNADERRRVLDDFSGTEREYEGGESLLEEYERQVREQPDAVALSSGAEQVSYYELNRRANQLGQWLRKRGVGAEKIVGLLFERSVEMVVGMLGVLKAGGAYLPLDPESPRERLELMLREAEVKVLLTGVELEGKVGGGGEVREEVSVGREWGEYGEESEANPERVVGRENLAYVIYTSGSSGRPKGVMITHGGICNRLQWMRAEYPLGREDRLLQKTAYVFDASVWEFFAGLWAGARLVLAEAGAQRESERLVWAVREHEVSTLQVVPTMLEVLVGARGAGECGSLERIFSGGERLGAEVAKMAGRQWPQVELTNLYGPTEVSIDATYWRVGESEGGVVPIGRPLGNVRVYVSGGGGGIAGVGETGELQVGGRGLARGYLQGAEQTAARFVPDGLSGASGERVYLTGDLGRWRGDGALEYLGREDGQVKVRGNRVELSEVETVLREHESVAEAVVVGRELQPGQLSLIAYVVLHHPAKTNHDSFDEQDELLRDTAVNLDMAYPSSEQQPLNETGQSAGGPGADLNAELRRHLQRHLPDYMLPSAFVFLPRLPLLPSGKLNRNALPLPESGTAGGSAFIVPRTPMEKRLTDIWIELLKVERVGVRDNFFELGGHSLLATELILRLREDLQVELPLKVLFRGAQTVEGLATEIEQYLIESSTDLDIAAALEEFEGLSEQEVKALLEIDALAKV
jgi:amino acid adenylation domain-containing protein